MIDASGATQTADCRGRDVIVQGDGSAVILEGGCRSLSVQGSGDHVQADMLPGGSIEVAGNGTSVDYFMHSPGPAPVQNVTGQGSVVRQIGRLGGTAIGAGLENPEPGSPTPMAIVGDGQQQDQDCAGRDVLLQGSDDNVTLRGGCRSLSITGSDDHVQMRIVPGSRIAITGDHDVVTFVLTSEGPDPIVSVSGADSHAWRVRRLGDLPNAGIEIGAAGAVVPGGAGAVVTEMPSVPQLMAALGAQQTPRGVLVRLSNDVLFDFDKYTIRLMRSRS